MKARILSGNIKKLLDDKQRLVREQPELPQSYEKFLHDWKRYEKARTSNKQTRSNKIHTIHTSFGASFKRET